MHTEAPHPEREIHTTRLLKARPDQVFNAWADPVRLATEARPIGGERHRLEGLAWFNCRRCESTLVVQVPEHEGEECPAPLEEHGPTFTLPSVDLC